MNKKAVHHIDGVVAGSIAEEMEIEAGDILLSINGKEIEDIFDYQYQITNDTITVLIKKKNGEEWELDIEKEYDEDLGIIFENGLMDDYKSCSNKCIFCFIDQMPEGMRETLYFKDDDSRLSFLQGNYVTLTNMSDKDIDRIIAYNLAPINISFHTTNEELRCKMLNNKKAGKALAKVKKFYEAGIEMNGQIVLCKGVNDGEELEKTIEDLGQYMPYLRSVSIVPVGLTKYRDKLYKLESFNKSDAVKLIETVAKWQKYYMDKFNTHFIHASDEWYILADKEFPKEESYDGYIQLENGVGMARLLYEEFTEALKNRKASDDSHEISLVTGVLYFPFIKELIAMLNEKYPNIKVNPYCIKNDFFGEKITVAGLITGKDIINQIKDLKLGERLLIPDTMLKSDEDIFLDDVTIDDIQNALQVKPYIVKSSGQALLDAFTVF
ncbi:putative radical SAM enzyme, TIGR03279 family [Acetitomaculum ruminis DSM 5522]|uniref:Putative radical SAM enzyme, TIGR03279 family n=1 Tax=Acetitomaculum ruminis DSM 5522 TaxID=1120918 RepID=A0A1I0VPD8_9FIRM|nr:DUF512 domain-containing protein [Acetitomaculum ruminis]SFA77867.1 putative radical SAM enzyme, TIGR03279 family [Acetitomaculum ruminis DSM 5522]